MCVMIWNLVAELSDDNIIQPVSEIKTTTSVNNVPVWFPAY